MDRSKLSTIWKVRCLDDANHNAFGWTAVIGLFLSELTLAKVLLAERASRECGALQICLKLRLGKCWGLRNRPSPTLQRVNTPRPKSCATSWPRSFNVRRLFSPKNGVFLWAKQNYFKKKLIFLKKKYSKEEALEFCRIVKENDLQICEFSTAFVELIQEIIKFGKPCEQGIIHTISVPTDYTFMG